MRRVREIQWLQARLSFPVKPTPSTSDVCFPSQGRAIVLAAGYLRMSWQQGVISYGPQLESLPVDSRTISVDNALKGC